MRLSDVVTCKSPALPLAAYVTAPGVALTIIVYNISGGGRPRHQVPVLGLAGHLEQICIPCHAWVWGRPRSPLYFPRLRLCPSGGYTSESPSAMVIAAKRMAQLPKAEVVISTSLVLWRWFFFFAVTQQLTVRYKHAVIVHAALGGGWPRWQPVQ
jgi:hypothetical protein